MKNTLAVSLVAGFLLLSFAVPPALAFAWGGDPAEILYAAITSPYPGYNLKADDFIRTGNQYKANCEVYSTRYNQRAQAYIQAEAAQQKTAVDVSTFTNPTAQQRIYLMSTGFHMKDPVAGEYYQDMMTACDLAEKNYNKAFDLTKDDNYDQQAEIFEAGSGVYDILGMENEADQTRNAAAVARAHAAASSFFLPLSPLAAIAGLLGGLLLISSRHSRNQ
jgi:hypothetical protein